MDVVDRIGREAAALGIFARSRIRSCGFSICAKSSGRGWIRTSSLLFVRQALSAFELLARVEIRDKGSNLDLHVQSVVSYRLDDPGTTFQLCLSVQLPDTGDRRRRTNVERTRRRSAHTPSLLFPSHSPTLRPWIAGRDRAPCAGQRPTWRSFGARASRVIRKSAGESTAQFAGAISARDAEEPFSLRRGLDFELELLKLGITSVPSFGGRLRKRRRRPVGSPSTGLATRLAG
jgi:hypothetical protein